MYEYTNSFHNSTVRSRYSPEQLEEIVGRAFAGSNREDMRKNQRIVRRIWKKLCGIEGCTCGDELGRR